MKKEIEENVNLAQAMRHPDAESLLETAFSRRRKKTSHISQSQRDQLKRDMLAIADSPEAAESERLRHHLHESEVYLAAAPSWGEFIILVNQLSVARGEYRLCIKVNNTYAREECVLCGQTFYPGDFAIFIEGTGTVICEACGRQFAPGLAHMCEHAPTNSSTQ
jgi:hypothetical protein